ncbi:MAG: CpaF family protein [Lachnospiraceae bacterium]|nr:CpaF family protein [Lachnospiraceae bacterium]
MNSKKEDVLSLIYAKMDYSVENDEISVRQLIGESLIEYGREHYLSLEEKQQLGKELFYSIRKLDILQELLEDKEITEIMINGPKAIFIEKNGRLKEWENSFSSVEKLEDVIQQIVGKCNRTVNEASPIADARLENGSRVNVVLPPIALNGPILTIRRFPDKPIRIENLIALGSITEDVASWLKIMVHAGYNIMISGGTGSGKTTFLNALSDFVPKEERIITIEDSAELQIQNAPNLVRLETRARTAENCNEITIRDLIKSSLRMRPDRIIVGEVRGAEAVDLLQAMNTGHDGSLSTGHANSARDMLYRLETMVLMGMDLPISAIRRQIASGIDLIVHLGRLRDKTRKVLEIVEVLGISGDEIETQTLYKFESSGRGKGNVEGKLVKKNDLFSREKIEAAGLSDLLFFQNGMD